MDLIAGSWATERDRVVAAGIVERLSLGLKDAVVSYEEACKAFAAGGFDGAWSWFNSDLFHCRFLVTDIFEDLRLHQEFDAMAVPWRKLDQKSGSELYSPPVIQVSGGGSAAQDIYEHEATHVAQLLVDHEFPGRPKKNFPGPIPFMSERILKEFEAHLVQMVYFERAYENRLVLDFNCIEAAQFAALRPAFSIFLKHWTSALVAHVQLHGPSSAQSFPASQGANELLKFGESLSITFRGTILESAGAIPTLDQLALHFYVQLDKQIGQFPINDLRRQYLLSTFRTVFFNWSDFQGSDPFQILFRFRPPNPQPRLNDKVIA
jgi:hypothetical protein